MHLPVLATYPIQPKHIHIPVVCFSAFNSRMDAAAVWVMKVQAQNGKWVAFTARHVEHACDMEHTLWSAISPGFDELVASGLLILMGHESGSHEPTYVVSHEFMGACFIDSPAPEVATTFPAAVTYDRVRS